MKKHAIDLSNKLTKKRLITMLKELFFEYRYISISKTGIVKFRTDWWSIYPDYTAQVFELCTGEIPKRIIQYRAKRTGYVPVYSTLSETIMRHKDRIDIVELLWREFVKIKTPLLIYDASNAIPESRIVVKIDYHDIPGSYYKSVVKTTALVRRYRKEVFEDHGFKIKLPEWLRRALFFRTGNTAFCQ